MLRLNLNQFLSLKEVARGVECVAINRFNSTAGFGPVGWSGGPLVDGHNATAVILGGVGSRESQIKRHSALYKKHNFNVMPILSGMLDLTTPEVAAVRGKALAIKLQNDNQPIVIHTISASFWTVMYMLENFDKDWREEKIKAIVFDSCPAMSDIEAFGGWMAVRMEQTSLKPFLSPLFHPFLSFCGITDEWRIENHTKMFGENAVIPRNANILFIYSKDDPVLDKMYIQSFIQDIKIYKSPEACVTEKEFEQSIHAMSIREHKEEYQQTHAHHLLSKVPEWSS